MTLASIINAIETGPMEASKVRVETQYLASLEAISRMIFGKKRVYYFAGQLTGSATFCL